MFDLSFKTISTCAQVRYTTNTTTTTTKPYPTKSDTLPIK